MTLPARLILAVGLVLAVLGSGGTFAEEIVLLDGRRLDAVVDGRTDGERLWFRTGGPRAYAVRAVPWSRVRFVRDGQRRYSASEFAHAVGTTRGEELQPADSPGSNSKDLKAEVAGRNVLHIDGQTDPHPAESLGQGRDGRERDGDRRRGNAPRATRLVALSASALAASWDRDGLWDGLILRLRPLDAGRRIKPVSGALSVTLHGSESTGTWGRREPLALERWTRSLTVESFRPGGAVVLLPYRSYLPEQDARIGSLGLVHVRLSVPGEGVFEESLDLVRLRRFSPSRDQLFLQTGSRLLPHEGVGQRRHRFRPARPLH